MSVRAIAGLGAALVALTFAQGAQANDRYAAFVMDGRTNEVLHADMAEEARFPASLTKVMTLYLMFDALDRGEITLQTRMPVSRFASRQAPSKLGLRRGDTITVESAIRALVAKSANDVAVVVAERLGGSEARFAQRMTTKARELGMTNTRFANASGLPNPAQRTSAKDMAMLGQAIWRNHQKYYNYFEISGVNWRSRWMQNHNRLLGAVAGVDGIKTGYTRASGFNLVTSVERDGVRLVAVVLGGESAAARDAQMAHLIETAYEQLGLRAGGGAQLVSYTISAQERERLGLDVASDPTVLPEKEQGSAESTTPPGEDSDEEAAGGLPKEGLKPGKGETQGLY
jgi:D-alanyl-D-alanine carboxypeptidase